MSSDDKVALPVFKDLPKSIQEQIINLFRQDKFVQSKKIYQEYIELLKEQPQKSGDAARQ